MKGSPAKPPRYPSARYNQQQPSAPPLSPPQSRGGEDGILPMPPIPAFPADLSGRTTDEPPSYMDDQMLLPPLAVPLGYGSGSSPPPYASAMPAMPVYRQQYQPTSPYRMSPPPLDANTQAPPAGGYFQYSANTSASPPQAFDMHRPRGSHRAYHQMYRQQSPQNHHQQQQPPSKCSSVWYFLKLLLFNAANGFLGIAGFTVVSVGLTLALVTLPLCCFGIVLFRVLLRVVYVGCQIDAVLHNLIASSGEKIQFGAHHHYHHHPGHMSSLAERHSLLPTQIDWQLQPHHQQDEDQLPQFEKTLAEVSPRAVLATIYFGSIKLLVGIFSLIAIGLVSFVIAFFVGSDDVYIMINVDGDAQEKDSFTMYMFAIGLAVFSVAMLFANARISQAITRFFCCEGGI